METELNKCFEEAIWVCRTLFQSGKVTESSANISFRCGDSIYIFIIRCAFYRILQIIKAREHDKWVISLQRKQCVEIKHTVEYTGTRVIIH